MTHMAELPLVLLDTSCVIAPPADLAELADVAAISTLTIAELAYGLHSRDPAEAARRQRLVDGESRCRTKR